MWLLVCIILVALLFWQHAQLRKLKAEQAQQGWRDPLTGLYLRPHLLELAEREVNRAQRGQRKISALIVDLDDCAGINAHFGHRTGDAALKKMAEDILGSVRDFDLVGRFSGEEIAVILADADEAGAMVVAERIRHRLAQHPLALERGEHLPVSVSIGVATLQKETDTLEDVLVAADQALQLAGKAGNSKIVAHRGQIDEITLPLADEKAGI